LGEEFQISKGGKWELRRSIKIRIMVMIKI
jgi:hypothetical protein